MADENQGTSKELDRSTQNIMSVKRADKSKILMAPQALFSSPPGSSLSDPLNGSRPSKKDSRQLVLTPQGKHVLTSDARLHLLKLKRQREKLSGATNNVIVDDELRQLDVERQILAEKLKRRKEIIRLQKELHEVSEGHISSEYQTENYESSWRTSMGSKYSKTEVSSDSLSSRKRKTRNEEKEYSENDDEDYEKEESSTASLSAKDILRFKEFIKSHSGQIEVSSESPLIKSIEKAKVNRDLKVPPIDQFDGSTDPYDFVNLFDGRMSFFGHNEVAKCQFFPTCLKGTTLMWFNNLPARSIKSWTSLKEKFKSRFSTNKKGKRLTTSLINVRQRANEGLREYLNRFRAEMIQIPDLVENLTMTYLAAGID